ncbi:MAG: hypothetical protein NTW87_22930 [Planctomycetota bacterium]|nr:hypothetical protein [Planctomycetota bacterium]
MALIETGDTAEAGRRLDVLCQSLPAESPYHALFVYNRGLALLRAGKQDHALSLFAAVLDSGCFENPRSSLYAFYPLLLNGLAAAYAIKGDVATAEHWQGLAHDHITPERSGMLLLNDTYIGIRAGRCAVVVKDAEASWAKAEGCLPGAQMQALRVLCAFALATTNPNGVNDAKIRQFLEAVQPCRPAQFDHLVINWPQLRDFLAEHGFAAASQAGTAAAAEQARGRPRPRREAQA